MHMASELLKLPETICRGGPGPSRLRQAVQLMSQRAVPVSSLSQVASGFGQVAKRRLGVG